MSNQLSPPSTTKSTNAQPADSHIEDSNLENSNLENSNPAASEGIRLALDYRAPSHVSADTSLTQAQANEQTQHVLLFTQLNRADVRFHARIKSPLVFRDTLIALFDVVSSDYRYVPKDRSAYSVFMQMRRSNANKNLFTAQRDYFTWLFNNDPLAFCILDPIIQVHQDGVSFEVFSRDEGCYAQLTLTHDIFAPIDSPVSDTVVPANPVTDIEVPDIEVTDATGASTIFGTIFGTTSIDYSAALYEGINQIRDYQNTVLDIGHDSVSLSHAQRATTESTDDADTLNTSNTSSDNAANNNVVTNNQIIEKRINVPKSWIRALLQVQSAGQLATDTIQLDPIALYNVLFELRMHADIKGKRRGLLIELQPQQPPVIILEPFNIAVTNQVSQSRFVYQGKQAKLIRLWGRRRLSLLKRLLPHTDSVSVSLLGQGMPSYWTLAGKGFHFNFAMTGFSQANWSQSLNFDLLLPKRPEHTHSDDLRPLLEHLQATPSTKTDLANTKDVNGQLTSQLLSATQQGFVRYDIATHTYYYRPLTQTPLDMAQFAHHNDAEKQAYDLIGRSNAIQQFSVKNIPTKGIVIQGDIHVSEDRRTYHSQLQLDEEGMVTKAECSCPHFLQHRLTQGVCAHLITLRLAYNAYDSSADSRRDGSWHETRVLSKRITGRAFNRIANKAATTVPKKSAAICHANSPNAHTANLDDANPSNHFNKQQATMQSVLDLSALAALAQPVNSQSTSDITGANQMAIIYITIEHKKVVIEQVLEDKTTRQQLVFNQPKQAFAAYQQHIARFEAKGFIENQGV